MTTTWFSFVLALVTLTGQAPAPAVSALDAAKVRVTPQPVTVLDMGRLKGVIRLLVWNPESTKVYLQTAELQPNALVKTAHHHVIDATTGAVETVGAAPGWAQDALAWKTGKTAPGDASFAIDLVVEQRRNAATALPMGGDYARGGTDVGMGASSDSVMSVAQQSQSGTANIMKLRGQVIGEFMNAPIVPGQTYGWGPAGSNAIVYAELSKRQLVVMDKSGARTKIDDTQNVVTPAFSADGRKLAWVEVKGKKATLVTGEITSR